MSDRPPEKPRFAGTPPSSEIPVVMRGSLAPTAPNTGAQAHSMAKAFTESRPSPANPAITIHPLQYGTVVEGQPGTPVKATKEQSVSASFQDKLRFTEQKGGSLTLESGGVRIEVTQVSNNYVEEHSPVDDLGYKTKPDRTDGHTFLIKIGGREFILHPTQPNEVVKQAEVEGMTDQQVGDLIKLLDGVKDLPQDIYKAVVDKAHKTAQETLPESYPEDLAAQTPIQVRVFAGHQGERGAKAIIVEPKFFGGGKLNFIQHHASFAQEYGEPITSEGVTLVDTGLDLTHFNGPQFTLEITGSKVTVVDGDGHGRTSQFGTLVTVRE